MLAEPIGTLLVHKNERYARDLLWGVVHLSCRSSSEIHVRVSASPDILFNIDEHFFFP